MTTPTPSPGEPWLVRFAELSVRVAIDALEAAAFHHGDQRANRASSVGEEYDTNAVRVKARAHLDELIAALCAATKPAAPPEASEARDAREAEIGSAIALVVNDAWELGYANGLDDEPLNIASREKNLGLSRAKLQALVSRPEAASPVQAAGQALAASPPASDTKPDEGPQRRTIRVDRESWAVADGVPLTAADALRRLNKNTSDYAVWRRTPPWNGCSQSDTIVNESDLLDPDDKHTYFTAPKIINNSSPKPDEGARAGGHASPGNGACSLCGDWTNSLASNPGEWPVWFNPLGKDGDEVGVAKPHHANCVRDLIAIAKKAMNEKPTASPAPTGEAAVLTEEAISRFFGWHKKQIIAFYKERVAAGLPVTAASQLEVTSVSDTDAFEKALRAGLAATEALKAMTAERDEAKRDLADLIVLDEAYVRRANRELCAARDAEKARADGLAVEVERLRERAELADKLAAATAERDAAVAGQNVVAVRELEEIGGMASRHATYTRSGPSFADIERQCRLRADALRAAQPAAEVKPPVETVTEATQKFVRFADLERAGGGT